MKAPLIDNRDLNAILKEIWELVPFFTPEWKPDTDIDAGTAIMNIFARMYTGVIQRLNRVPDKNFIAFLNMLGLKLLPASQARGPITFELSAGALDSVLIPARTQVAAQSANGGRPIVFESELSIMATPAKLTEAISYNPSKNMITQASATFIDAKATAPYELFADTDLQSHMLYLGHSDLFNIKSTVSFMLKFDGASFTDRQLDALAKINWQYASDEGWIDLGKSQKNLKLELIKDQLIKDQPTTIGEIEVNGIKSRWIRGFVDPKQVKEVEKIQFNFLHLSVINKAVAPDLAAVAPDLAYYNNIPLDVENVETSVFYPFGKTPRLYDTFYLASQEVLSKKGAAVTISFTVEHEPRPGQNITDIVTAQLSWEYWNGSGWLRLSLKNGEENFQVKKDANDSLIPSRTGTVLFDNPNDMAETVIQGQQNYWIRCKIASGDYGKEVYEKKSGTESYELVPHFIVPKISKFGFEYDSNTDSILTNMQHILTYNNLEYRDRTSDVVKSKNITPFYLPGDLHQTLYLGFDKPLLKGPISIYINVQDQDYSESNYPRLEWEYYRESEGRNGWTRLEVQDGTRHLTQSGCVEFVGLPDFAIAALFGKSLYWIRAIDVEDRFQSSDADKITRIKSRSYIASKDDEDDCDCGPEPCADFILFDPRFSQSSSKGITPSPKLNGIYLNTVMAAHCESVPDEILGSSTGASSPIYNFSKYPVLSEEIYVNELNVLSEEERMALKKDATAHVRETNDEAGNTSEFWVQWTAIENIHDSDKDGRHYEIDRTFGKIQFGDGIHGKVPPIGSNNIRASYKTGGGTVGNIRQGEIKILRTSIAFVDRLNNPYAFDCGYDTELLEHALERGPRMIRTRNRAVTAADYEQLTLQSSRGIAKVKCLPNFNDKGELETGWVTMIIVPQSSEMKPVPTAQLRQQVEAYLRDRAANVVAPPRHIKVFGPLYAEVAISARIVASSFDAMPTVEQEANRKLRAFLHPLTGGKEGRGWEYGKLPCLSDFYALFEADRKVDHVEALTMTIRDAVSGTSIQVTPNTLTDIRSVPYLLIYSGEHKLVVTGLPVS